MYDQSQQRVRGDLQSQIDFCRMFLGSGVESILSPLNLNTLDACSDRQMPGGRQILIDFESGIRRKADLAFAWQTRDSDSVPGGQSHAR